MFYPNKFLIVVDRFFGMSNIVMSGNVWFKLIKKFILKKRIIREITWIFPRLSKNSLSFLREKIGDSSKMEVKVFEGVSGWQE